MVNKDPQLKANINEEQAICLKSKKLFWVCVSDLWAEHKDLTSWQYFI